MDMIAPGFGKAPLGKFKFLYIAPCKTFFQQNIKINNLV